MHITWNRREQTLHFKKQSLTIDHSILCLPLHRIIPLFGRAYVGSKEPHSDDLLVCYQGPNTNTYLLNLRRPTPNPLLVQVALKLVQIIWSFWTGTYLVMSFCDIQTEGRIGLRFPRTTFFIPYSRPSFVCGFWKRIFDLSLQERTSLSLVTALLALGRYRYLPADRDHHIFTPESLLVHVGGTKLCLPAKTPRARTQYDRTRILRTTRFNLTRGSGCNSILCV